MIIDLGVQLWRGLLEAPVQVPALYPPQTILLLAQKSLSLCAAAASQRRGIRLFQFLADSAANTTAALGRLPFRGLYRHNLSQRLSPALEYRDLAFPQASSASSLLLVLSAFVVLFLSRTS